MLLVYLRKCDIHKSWRVLYILPQQYTPSSVWHVTHKLDWIAELLVLCLSHTSTSSVENGSINHFLPTSRSTSESFPSDDHVRQTMLPRSGRDTLLPLLTLSYLDTKIALLQPNDVVTF